MGNILKRCFSGGEEEDGQYPYYHPASRPHYQPHSPHEQEEGHGVAALAQDLLNFESTASMVPEGLRQHVTASKKAQVKWYQNMLEAYKNTTPPPRTPAEAAQLVATALDWIQRADLEGILEFYGFSIPSLPAASSTHHPQLLPEGVQFVLNTLPVNNKNIGDGDGFTAYVATTDPRESAIVPLEVHEMVIERNQARNRRDYQSADALQNRLNEAGYKILVCSDEEILARKYRIRMRGIDAPELKMAYGKESRNALVKLIGGKRTIIHVYGLDQFERYVGDIYCDNVFIQEQMLKNGHAWYFKKYDKRGEFAKWEREARAAYRGLFVLENPEKPWDWRKKQRNGGIPVC
ncbi:probable staphylococcal-like nuclease CAN2 [Brachypodium distachyon]|uniref:TNase-like domain-containing protein n=1 Tax=Brachypodium distachyon TaxID=15368 RepID=A0A0Q3PJR6_BRADI|nr:probable staphylococcal-like nuclease CAN2 [Brachypodium distachyon]KQJ89625.1 hypothetical protein BRADI_4g26860v3 [Brachypodium distachyon]|eukprot:XP_003577905.1 probable staphylococcal-like nuclease CAN2 [Brachypodium distachyon]